MVQTQAIYWFTQSKYMKISSIEENFLSQNFKHFHLNTLKVQSQALKGNPWGDVCLRLNPLLIPKKTLKNLPVVFILSGFSGNGSKYFNLRFQEENFPQLIDRLVDEKKAPQALYIFVDALSFWGGSQFINSEGVGNYENYIMKELVPSLKKHFPLSTHPSHWCVFGGSSGGYGALHLSSKYPQVFGSFVAIAPDSFFEQSLLPEIYGSFPLLESYGFSLGKIRKEVLTGQFFRKKGAFDALNVIAMGCCYAYSTSSKNILWPITEKGEKNSRVWKTWLKKDPLIFLKSRSKNLKKIRHKYLDVGVFDEYRLQFGARKIQQIFKEARLRLFYSEFLGSHRDISQRRPQALAWLNEKWN